MELQPSQPLAQAQRVQIEIEPHPQQKRVKIRVESHDEGLGWYTAASLTFPLHQLPLLEQALVEMRRRDASETESSGKIIPFRA